jgi:hypothetical protein
VTSLAFLVDQMFSPAPGGMGTYVREIVPALSRAEPPLDISLFHARFDPGIPERWTAGLTEAIERVINDQELAARLSESGKRRAERFSWEEAARQTLEVYKSVL